MSTPLPPLPPIVARADEHYHGEGLADAVHAHAAAVSAERDARIKELEDVLRGRRCICARCLTRQAVRQVPRAPGAELGDNK